MALILKATDLTIYTTPMDCYDARRDFLGLMRIPKEKWVAAFAFTDRAVIEALKRMDRSGIKSHFLLDASQSMGNREHVLIGDLVLESGDITLSTTGPLSSKPRTIMHHKVLVSQAEDGGEDWCWVGSINFTETGWYQANTAMLFRSNEWARTIFIPWFEKTKEWALQHVPQRAEQLDKDWIQGEEDDEPLSDLSVPDWL